MAKTAVVRGASGLVGSNLLDLLLEKEDYNKVIVYARKQLNKEHSKLD